MNSAKCFAFAVARGAFHGMLEVPYSRQRSMLKCGQDQWIWWFGPLAGSLVQTAVYWAVPPYHTRAK